MTTTNTSSQGRLMFELGDCTRCGGTGTYSWCQRFGDTCFKCSGNGQQLTRAATKAREAMQAWKLERASVPVESVEVGQLVRVRPGDKLRRVVEVRQPSESGAASIAPDGTRTALLGLVTKGMTYCMAPGETVQRQLTPAEQLELDAYLLAMPGVYRA